jgi:hypothetical protein
MAVKIQFRRDTAANWLAVNPILAEGELGLETDTGKFKLGIGATEWIYLLYVATKGTDGADGADGTDGADGADGADGIATLAQLHTLALYF